MAHQSTHLCNFCNSIFVSPRELETQLTAPHHADASSLKEAADADCYICARIWRQSFGTSDDLVSLPQLLSLRYWLAPRGDERFELNFDVRTNQVAIRSSFLGLKLAHATQLGTQRTIAPTTRSSESFRQARKWIAHCRDHHSHCHRVATTDPLPTRMIFVERRGNARELLACLCKSDSLPTQIPYLTLSHRWGTANFLTLTRHHLDRFQQSIPVAELSCAFQDALHATVELGFNYIWIDSLCIVQDDAMDWLNESERMGQVYKNAACNLSASGFESGRQGFLPEERRSDPTPVFVRPKWKKLRSTALRKHSGESFALSALFPWFDIWDGPLFSRAWVLQEQILARRAIHFGTDQIFWECNDSLASEVWPLGWGPQGRPGNPFQELLAISLKRQPFWLFSLDKLDGLKNQPPHDIWRKIVENYSVRNLTRPTDRLPALSGIASEFSKILNDEYLLGLWKRDLHLGLLWKQTRSPSEEPNNIPNWGSVPSWSWAALNKPVQWYFPCSEQLEMHSGFKDQLSEIIEYNVSVPTPSIRIRGNLMKSDSMLKSFTIRYISRDRVSIIERDGFAFDFDFDQWYPPQCGVWQSPWESATDQTLLPEQEIYIRQLASKTLFLPMLYTQDGQRMGAIGLLLWREPKHGRGAYRRVGTANMWSDFTQINRQDFEIDAWYYQKHFEEDDFLEYDLKGKYDITLV